MIEESAGKNTWVNLLLIAVGGVAVAAGYCTAGASAHIETSDTAFALLPLGDNVRGISGTIRADRRMRAECHCDCHIPKVGDDSLLLNLKHQDILS